MDIKELKAQLNQAVKKGYIFPHQLTSAIKKFKKDGDLAILETIEKSKANMAKAQGLKKTKWYDLDEIDALRMLVKQNYTIIEDQKAIKGWITFLGIVTLLSLIGSIIIVSETL